MVLQHLITAVSEVVCGVLGFATAVHGGEQEYTPPDSSAAARYGYYGIHALSRSLYFSLARRGLRLAYINGNRCKVLTNVVFTNVHHCQST